MEATGGNSKFWGSMAHAPKSATDHNVVIAELKVR